MRQISDTIFISDDKVVGCVSCLDGSYAYAQINDHKNGVVQIKNVATLDEAKQLISEYENAMKDFMEVFNG